jgi:glyceraldehyde 3-phosphate dehydrogenase
MLEKVLPDLAGRLTGYAMNVPVVNGSVVDLVCWHEREITREAVNDALRGAAGQERWRRILQYETEPIVSSDIAHTSYSSVFDSLATMTLRGAVSKTLSWFDSGYGYAYRAVELLDRYAELEAPGGAAA